MKFVHLPHKSSSGIWVDLAHVVYLTAEEDSVAVWLREWLDYTTTASIAEIIGDTPGFVEVLDMDGNALWINLANVPMLYPDETKVGWSQYVFCGCGSLDWQ